MERVYPPRQTAKFKIKDHMKQFLDTIPIDGVETFPENDEDIQKLMGMEGDNTKFISIMNSIDLGQISSDHDIPVETFDPTKTFYNRNVGVSIEIPTDALKLHTIQARLNKHQNAHCRIDERKSKHSKHRRLNPDNSDEELGNDLVPFQETVISLRFYQPFKFEPDNPSFQVSFCQEFLVLGSQKLSVLRNKIFCSASYGPFPEISENHRGQKPQLDDDSAFFFITDTFYNDFSRPYSKDYSSPIIEWAKNIDDIDDLKSSSMEDISFEDLTVRIGYPQVYQHYGNCEHLFVFSDVRLLQSSDILQRSQYPYLRTVSNNRCHICFICGVNPVAYLVRECKRQIADPTFYCNICFETYLYKDGKKIGNFKAYRFAESRPST